MEERKRPQFEKSEVVFSVPTGKLENEPNIKKETDKKILVPGKIIKRLSSDTLNIMVLKQAEELVKRSNIPMGTPSNKNTMPLGMNVPTAVNKDFNIIHKRTGEIIRVKPIFTIGAGEDADFTVRENGFMSRLHAKLRIEGSALLLEDTNSLNGTFLNGKKVEGFIVQMKSGDTFKLANEEFVVQ